MLPLPSVEVDRVTQMKGLKLAIQYFRLHQMLPTKGDRHVKNSVRHLWLNDIFQHEAKIILVVDSSGTIIYVSEQAVNVLGLFQVDVIGANYCEVVHSEDQEDFKKLLDGDAVHCHLIRMKDTLSPNAKHKGNFQCRVMHISVLGHCEKKDLSVTVLACEPFDKVPILEIVISASSEFTVNPHTNTIIDVDWK
jgi:PAS domain S-box-containing protein